MIELDRFFDHLDEFPYKQIFKGVQFVWEPLGSLRFHIETIFDTVTRNAKAVSRLEGVTLAVIPQPGTDETEAGIYVDRWVKIAEPVYFPEEEISLGAGTVLEPTAVIKGPAVIGSHCGIRQGAYLRGNVIAGDRCTIGHATEIKNSVLMNHTEAGHFNYIGDSILGSHVNLGAGTKLANLQFRSPEEKTGGSIHPIAVPVEGKDVNTEMAKLGAVLGDFVEMGCNSVTSPGVLLGKDSWVYPNLTVPKGYYPPRTFLAPHQRKPHLRTR